VRRAAGTWVALVVLVVVAVLTAGWSGGGRAPRPGAPPASPPATGGARPTPVLTAADLPAGYVLQRAVDDTGEPVRDVCGRALGGGRDRHGTREQVATGAGRRVRVDLATYAAGAAATVLDRVRASVAACPHGPSPHRLRGIQSLDRRYAAVVSRDRSLTVVVTVTDRAGHRHRTGTAYARHGDLLSVVTVDPVTARRDALLASVAAAVSARLGPGRGTGVG
jgi:hypothetical protein